MAREINWTAYCMRDSNSYLTLHMSSWAPCRGVANLYTSQSIKSRGVSSRIFSLPWTARMLMMSRISSWSDHATLERRHSVTCVQNSVAPGIVDHCLIKPFKFLALIYFLPVLFFHVLESGRVQWASGSGLNFSVSLMVRSRLVRAANMSNSSDCITLEKIADRVRISLNTAQPNTYLAPVHWRQ